MVEFDCGRGGGELQTVDLQNPELEGRGRSSVLHYPIIIVHSLVSYFRTLPSTRRGAM